MPATPSVIWPTSAPACAWAALPSTAADMASLNKVLFMVVPHGLLPGGERWRDANASRVACLLRAWLCSHLTDTARCLTSGARRLKKRSSAASRAWQQDAITGADAASLRLAREQFEHAGNRTT